MNILALNIINIFVDIFSKNPSFLSLFILKDNLVII